MYILTAYLQILITILAIITAISFLISFIRKKNIISLKLFLFFITISAISFSFGLPLIINPNDSVYVSSGIIAALLFTLLTVIIAFEIPKYSVDEKLYKYKNFIKNILAFLGIIFISYSLINPPTPTIDSSGLVFWGINPITGWGFGTIVLISSILWSYLYYKSIDFVQSDTSTKIKMFILSIDGIMWGLSAIIYFNASSVIEAIIAITLMISSFLITAIVFWMLRQV